MSEEEKERIKELIRLLYRDDLSQFGKRNLETYINKLIAETEKVKQLEKENEELKEEKERTIGLYAQASLNVKSLNGMVNELDNKVKLKDKAIEELQKENEQLRDIKNKAIGHINACKTNLGNYVLSPSEMECLLEILKEEEND